MNKFAEFVIVLGLFLIIDLPVILIANKSMYQTQFTRINKQPVISGPHIWLAGGFAYLLLALGIYWFIVEPETNNLTQLLKSNYTNVMGKSALLGLVIYGVYNGTNMATINEWGTKEFIVDTLWGTFLSGVIGASSVYLINKLG
jgi:uncharacterized membrane protein